MYDAAAKPATAAEAPTPAGEGNGAALESVTRNPVGQLVVRLKGGAEHVDARVARCFPWTLPDLYISIRDKDGKELCLVKTLEDLAPAGRELIREELEQKVFNPRILKVLDLKQEFGITSILAQTDRGQTTFQVRSRDDIRVLSAARALFRDADGNTYELHDLRALDAASRKHLAQYF